ncbi:GNAT family N-acetyltransferase [Galactobacter caseinivorans]|uniref:N-acetyltransferase n=1 Tax=Galactobacter caseinivorans TaxID=2676123 RepID=A0A496PKT5_9MICC|nr:GNAT family N-acetyltransferase [Galactobacter caseinivorans]RKW71126.1 N-acetyltransferase [Galactobacter caseinivorans]
MQLRPLDVNDHPGMVAAFQVECAATQHARPGRVSQSQDARLLGWRAEDGLRKRLIGAWDEETLLGFAAGMNATDSPETTWVFVWVAPQHQARGIGTTLVRAIENASVESTNSFVASAYRPTAQEVEWLTQTFARRLGYTLATSETVVELDLAHADLPEASAARGYTISPHLNGVPLPHRVHRGGPWR